MARDRDRMNRATSATHAPVDALATSAAVASAVDAARPLPQPDHQGDQEKNKQNENKPHAPGRS